jgi:acetyl-CoA carboxylase biotin carboxyl carrier protein
MARAGSFQPHVVARLEQSADGRFIVLAPTVGEWRGAPAEGVVLSAGGVAGELEILGVLHALRMPDRAWGRVVERGADGRAQVPVQYGDVLLVLDPSGTSGEGPAVASAPRDAEAQGLVFRAPSSGRFYGRPSPDAPPFLSAGDEVAAGKVVCLLEIMKTFNRVAYASGGGEGLPDRARVRRVVPADGADLDAGDPILELEPVESAP